MIRWIVFEAETAEMLVSHFRRGAAQIEHADALGEALAENKFSMLVLPCSEPGKIVLAKFGARNGVRGEKTRENLTN